MFTTFRTAMQKRALYNRTRRELEALPTRLAVEDLGIFPGDARSIASNAVYGR
ncbi:hypothetical protein [Pelagovum pacificum]|uniref:hypothetical protein n=1 Tax=Pelagovum pacificum TaxID=2588711 RepID=UPI0018CE7596|nr:hypothetical protein [Pelagovum pacificum]QQA44500.1 hypothetical protein I8N54_08000 [Pelagovum pacificum]